MECQLVHKNEIFSRLHSTALFVADRNSLKQISDGIFPAAASICRLFKRDELKASVARIVDQLLGEVYDLIRPKEAKNNISPRGDA